MEVTENKQTDLELIYGCDVTCNHSIITSPSSSTIYTNWLHLAGLVKPHVSCSGKWEAWVNGELHTTQSPGEEQAVTHQGQFPLPIIQIGGGLYQE